MRAPLCLGEEERGVITEGKNACSGGHFCRAMVPFIRMAREREGKANRGGGGSITRVVGAFNAGVTLERIP